MTVALRCNEGRSRFIMRNAHRIEVGRDQTGLTCLANGARGNIIARQIKRERAADARRADESDFAAEQTRELAADRETKSRTAVFAARAAVGLLERLEDDLLLVGRDADAGIHHRE